MDPDGLTALKCEQVQGFTTIQDAEMYRLVRLVAEPFQEGLCLSEKVQTAGEDTHQFAQTGAWLVLFGAGVLSTIASGNQGAQLARDGADVQPGDLS
jgi:hypothetical protein